MRVLVSENDPCGEVAGAKTHKKWLKVVVKKLFYKKRGKKKKEEKSGRVDESGIINGFQRLVGLALVLWAAKRFFFIQIFIFCPTDVTAYCI